MYLIWQTKTITDFSDNNINSLYNEGYLFGRTGKGEMYQTRSLRVDLEKFKLSSENKRILKKTDNLNLETASVPYSNYHWSIHKMGKDFYDTKFGNKTFSANKIKELMTDKEKSNFNLVFIYNYIKGSLPPDFAQRRSRWRAGHSSFGLGRDDTSGYCIAYQTPQLLHYCYPFYDLDKSSKDTGLGMMLGAILWAKENNKKYVYLGSASRPTDTYKLQFAGVEWFEGKNWKNNLTELKKILKT